MDKILERIESRLERLEAQNEIIRKELHGIRPSSSNSDNSFALMEAKTLREVVEEIQFNVSSLNSKLTNIEKNQEAQATAETTLKEEFQVVEIRSKTAEEEENWLKGKFHEMRAKSRIEDGASFQGRTLENISNSTPLRLLETSCVLKLSNHLNMPLTDPQFENWNRIEMTGPSVVPPHFTEIFRGSGYCCHFLYSISIRNSLKLALYCQYASDNRIVFIAGFISHNVPTDEGLCFTMKSMEPSPDLRRNGRSWTAAPAELFVTTGQFLSRCHMKTDGRRVLVEVDIFEMAHCSPNGSLTSFPSHPHLSSSLARSMEKISRNLIRSQDFHWKISCSVEVFNLLNVTLRSEDTFYMSSKRNNFQTFQVQPFKGATSCVSDDKNVEGMFSFEIDSTDLCLVIAFKAQGNQGNCFAGAFLPQPAPPASKQEMEKLMSEEHWKSHEWRKSAHAQDGEQVLQIRNIRAIFSMTEGEKSVLKIRVFAF